MPPHALSPSLDLLAREYVLVPAWKKAHDYIRRHNWYADVLDLDLANADVGATIRKIALDIQESESLTAMPLRLVIAPKNQAWQVTKDRWIPTGGAPEVARRLRPLAHLTVRDQIIGTAFMLLLSDIVEARQGDPRKPALQAHKDGMVSYGHRLFCDEKNGELQFRWGNAGVYRQYFQDYQNFVARPDAIVKEMFDEGDTNWAIISADLSQFYDRVRPSVMHSQLQTLLGPTADKPFVRAFNAFFDWQWHEADLKDALKYAAESKPEPISDFDRVALPQGLVASGFFANLVLIAFDDAIKESYSEIHTDWQLVDYCRYVDDMRFVVRLAPTFAEMKQQKLVEALTASFSKFLSGVLRRKAPGLFANHEKFNVVLGKNSGAGTIRVSSNMRRVNHHTSGVMDMFVGEETLELVETLLYSTPPAPVVFRNRFQETILAAKPDVREDTVARFAAHRFRSAFRTLRPMSEFAPEDSSILESAVRDGGKSDFWNTGRFRLASTLTREVLDQKAMHFATRLVGRWIRDPSHMRLLRVALDLRPDAHTLNLILDLLGEYIGANTKRKAPRRVAWYCAAELLKAGATETGLVSDDEQLPADADLAKYQQRLAEFAKEIVRRRVSFPWYLVQQAYLYLACVGEYIDQQATRRSNPQLLQYIRLHRVLNGDYDKIPPALVPRFALLHAGLVTPAAAAKAFYPRFTEEGEVRQRRWLIRILSESYPLGSALWERMSVELKREWKSLFLEYGVVDDKSTLPTLAHFSTDAMYTVLEVSRSPANPFRQEYTALQFARALIPLLDQERAITPNDILISSNDWMSLDSGSFPLSHNAFRLQLSSKSSNDIRFVLPDWIDAHHRWKYQLGMLLRVLLTGQADYTLDRRTYIQRSIVAYRPYRSSWLRRRYGMFNGRNAFGPSWIPISSWFGSLLTKLLKWPGFPDSDFELELSDDCDTDELFDLINARLEYLERLYGVASRTPFVPLTIPKEFGPSVERSEESSLQTMRIAVAQTVIPRHDDFLGGDPELLDPAMRRRHRRHTASVLAGIQRMLEVRTTHQDSTTGIELLVLPELSVHPRDLHSLLVPFVKRNRCIVCAGIGYQRIDVPKGKLVNCAVWLIPVRRPTGSIGIEIVEQGKKHMTVDEEGLGISPFRPAQWVLEIVDPRKLRTLWAMSAAVCYDATDLSLVSDLRNRTHLFIVPALNKDVGTFDNLAAALHYHMYQHVVVANSGEFGGSSGHAPFHDRNRRCIFHTHGNDQVTVSFFEVELDIYRRSINGLKTRPANHTRE